MTTRTIRATYPAPQPRTSITGAVLEDKLVLSFARNVVTGFRAEFDVVLPDGSTRRLTSSAFEAPIPPSDMGTIANILISALTSAGVVPVGSSFSLVDEP